MTNNEELHQEETRTTTFIGPDASGELQKVTIAKGPNVVENTKKEKPIFDGYVSYMWYTNKETGKKEILGFQPVNYDSVVNAVDNLMEDVKMLKSKIAEQEQEIMQLKYEIDKEKEKPW